MSRVPDHVALPIEELKRQLGVGYPSQNHVVAITNLPTQADRRAFIAVAARAWEAVWCPHGVEVSRYCERCPGRVATFREPIVFFEWEHAVRMLEKEQPNIRDRLGTFSPLPHALECWRAAANTDKHHQSCTCPTGQRPYRCTSCGVTNAENHLVTCKLYEEWPANVKHYQERMAQFYGHCAICGVKQDFNSCPHWMGKL